MEGTQYDTFIGPKALQAAREHFNYPELSGIPQETSVKFPKTYWAKKYLLGEVMNEADEFPSVLSKISLAYLEDSGWYGVDYSKARDYLIGKNAGSSYFSGCSVNGQCTAENQETCSLNYESKATCATDGTCLYV